MKCTRCLGVDLVDPVEIRTGICVVCEFGVDKPVPSQLDRIERMLEKLVANSNITYLKDVEFTGPFCTCETSAVCLIHNPTPNQL